MEYTNYHYLTDLSPTPKLVHLSLILRNRTFCFKRCSGYLTNLFIWYNYIRQYKLRLKKLLLLLFSCLVMSYSLWPHGLQHVRPPHLSPSPRVCPSSCSLHWWCHPVISSSDALFSCPQSFPVSGTFPMSCLEIPKYWSFSISPSSEYSGLISLRIDWFDILVGQGTFRSIHQHHSLKASILWHSAFFMVQLSKPYRSLGRS